MRPMHDPDHRQTFAMQALTVEICIPIYCHDPTVLIQSLARQHFAAETALRIYDDGSADPDLTARIQSALAQYPGPTTLMTAGENLGRAKARNALISAAQADWLLLLDGDMEVTGEHFLQAYREAALLQGEPCCIVGGFGVDMRKATPTTLLHALQSRRSECLDAITRNRDPGRYVFTSNIFLHRRIFAEVPFNGQFRGWGWEDVEWGPSVQRRFPGFPIANAGSHLGLDEDRALLRKYEHSGQNFLLMLEEHPESVRRMPVYRIARTFSHVPWLGALTWASRRAVLSGRHVLPAYLRLCALKLFRATIYAQALHAEHR